jgi:hypothetical protein
VLTEELINNVLFQRYYTVAFLGQNLQCSIEFPQNFNIELNHTDMTDPTTNQKNVQLTLKVCTNYPAIDENTEVANSSIVRSFIFGQSLPQWSKSHPVSLIRIDDENIKSSIKIHLGEDSYLYDENGNSIEQDILGNKIINEFEEPMTRLQIIRAFNYNTNGISSGSELFSGSISKIVDDISRNF